MMQARREPCGSCRLGGAPRWLQRAVGWFHQAASPWLPHIVILHPFTGCQWHKVVTERPENNKRLSAARSSVVEQEAWSSRETGKGGGWAAAAAPSGALSRARQSPVAQHVPSP